MIPRPALARLLKRLRFSHRADRNIVGVSAGLKYVEEEAQPGLAIRFYVKKKLARPGEKRIPAEITATVAGRRRTFATDVIAVGRIRGAAPAGSLLRTPFNRGAAAFVLSGASGPALITCAHVLRGDRYYASTLHPVTSLEGVSRPPGVAFVARPRWAAAPVKGRLDFDCGIALFDPAVAAVIHQGLAVRGVHVTAISGFERLALGASMDASCPRSGAVSLRLDSIDDEDVEVTVRDGSVLVGHLFAVRSPARALRQGDSGGLIFSGARGLGYLVAVSGADPKMGWAHSLGPAVEYARARATGVF